MIKVRVIKDFSLKEFAKIKNIERFNYDKVGELYKNDIFECDDKMARYLTGDNSKKEIVVEIIEIKIEKPKKEEPKKTTNKKVAKK